MESNILEGIERFSEQNILVIGEAMLDKFLVGRSHRLNREAPVPIVDLESQTLSPGGAANAAVNVVELGGKVHFLSVTGDDQEGEDLRKVLKEQGVSPEGILMEEERTTLTKQRVMSGNHMLVRFDNGDTHALRPEVEQEIIRLLREKYPVSNAVVVSDYGYGVVTPKIVQTIHELQQQHQKVLIVDSKYLDTFKDIAPPVVKPNYKEAVNLLGITQQAQPGQRVEQIKQYKEEILKVTGAGIAAVTLDIEGSIIFERNGGTYRTHTKPVENSKAVGAGDTYTSTFALALGAGLSTAAAAEVSAAAATVVAQKDGTATCTSKELRFFFSIDSKHINDDHLLQQLIERYRELDKKVVFTNGCFDILHSGHVRYLNKARELGDVLIVGLNSDESVKRLKGPERPINEVYDRVQVLSGLSCIDHVVVFEDDTPIDLIRKIKPDLFVKGGDYKKEALPETEVVEELGGKTQIIPLIKGRSTTNIIKKFKEMESVNGSNSL